MHATHLHPRPALPALAAFAFALAALMPATLDDASFSLGGSDRSAPAQAPAPAAATPRDAPAWHFAYPLLQAPSR